MSECALFIDLENITTSLWQKYQQTPDPFNWMEKAKTYGPVAFARAYGDFSQPHLDRLTLELRNAGIEKFDCPTKQRDSGAQSTVDSNIMIDLFEVAIDRPQIKTFILMAGDSDYIRVVTRLRNRLEKTVVISAVPGSVSRDLVRAAGNEDSLTPAQPSQPIDRAALIRLIDNFESSRRPGVFPVFGHLIRFIGDDRNSHVVRAEFAHHAINELLADGVMVQYRDQTADGTPIRVTCLDRGHPEVQAALNL